MNITCRVCRTCFDFNQNDIKEKKYFQKKEKVVNRRPIIKRHFFQENEYFGIITYTELTYSINKKIIVCPVCQKEIVLCERKLENENEKVRQETVDEVEMFGPNPPCVVGESTAIDYWVHRP